jgi:hypothetical protein
MTYQFNVEDKWYFFADEIRSVSGELNIINDVSINGNLKAEDASFNNVDISGSLTINNLELKKYLLIEKYEIENNTIDYTNFQRLSNSTIVLSNSSWDVFSMKFSGNGNILAIGKPLNDFNNIVQIYQYNDICNNYIPFPNTSNYIISVDNTSNRLTSLSNPRFGWDLALSHDGTKLFIGSLGAGIIPYKYDSTNSQWIEYGKSPTNNNISLLNLDSTGSLNGVSVSCNADGNIVILGDRTVNNAKVFKLNSTSDVWESMAFDTNHDRKGHVYMVPDGSRFFIGINPNTNNTIQTIKYWDYSSVNNEWVYSNTTFNSYTYEFSSTPDGNTVIGGSDGDNKDVYINKYINNSWSQSIISYPYTVTNKKFGWFVLIDSTGNYAFISTRDGDKIHIYEYNSSGNNWSDISANIIKPTSGDDSFDNFGYGMHYDENNQVLAVGSNQSNRILLYQIPKSSEQSSVFNIINDVSINGNLKAEDASFNNLNISEGKLALNNNTILEKRITSGSIFKCANFFEDFNSTIRFASLVRTNGNNNYAMIHHSTNHRIFDRYTKKNFTIGGNSTTSNYAEAQFDYWHQSITQYTITNSTTLVFDECIFGDYNYDNRGSITIYRRDESNFDWTYQNSLQNYNSYVGNFTYQANKLHLSPDGSRLFWTSKTSKMIYMLYRGQRNRSYNDVFGQYRDFLYSLVHDGNWNSHIRISNSIEGQFSNVRVGTGQINHEYVHYQFDSNTDGTILTALSTSNSNHTTDTKIYILYSPTLKSSPEGIFNTQTGHINNLSDISAGDIPDSTRLNNVGIHNDYFIFQTLLFNDSTDGIFDISYGYSSGNTNPNIDSISGPIGRIINTSTTVYLEVSKLSNQLLLYSKQIMSNDGLTLVVNDRGYKDVTPFADSHVGCIIILERPTIDVSFTYSTFFEGADFVGASHPVTFGTALAITQSDQIYAGSVNTGIMGHNFIINKIGNQWVETLLELPRNANSSVDYSDGQGFGSYGGVVNMSSDGNSLVGGYSINAAYVGVEYYLKESNENFITSYGAIHNSIRADYIYNNFGAQLTSDDRYKIQEKIINNGLQTIRLLNPKKYLKTTLEYKADYSGNIQPNDIVFEESGLIAQELLDISNLNYVVSENDNKYNVRYNDIFIHGLAATKELDNIVTSQKEEITELKNALNTLLTEAGKSNI